MHACSVYGSIVRLQSELVYVYVYVYVYGMVK